jgi:hypothetical protein
MHDDHTHVQMIEPSLSGNRCWRQKGNKQNERSPPAYSSVGGGTEAITISFEATPYGH